VGGLIVSQCLTLFTTPVVYLFFDRLRGRFEKRAMHSQQTVLPNGPAARGAVTS